jgi:hypothetical protein
LEGDFSYCLYGDQQFLSYFRLTNYSNNAGYHFSLGSSQNREENKHFSSCCDPSQGWLPIVLALIASFPFLFLMYI